jgi:hypothetical protein
MDTPAVLVVAGIVVLVPLVWWITIYNRFVRLKHGIKESWADIDVRAQAPLRAHSQSRRDREGTTRSTNARCSNAS